MKGLILLADGFEDVEAITPLDVLSRARISCDKVSMMDGLNIITSHGLQIKADKLFKDIDQSEYDFLIIPGGKAVATILDFDPRVVTIINSFIKQNKLIAAICAAPSLIGKLGYLKDKSYTCFPGFNEKVLGGNYLKNEGVVVSSEKIITAKSMYYSLPFALTIIASLYGKEFANSLACSIEGN